MTDALAKTADPPILGQAVPRVVVLMSAFNGERFIAAQLRSILDQLPEHGRILIRDDGSSDATVATVARLSDPRISLTHGHNLGFGASFLSLLMAAPDNADLVMFSDQDDVWLPRKIERAWQHLRAFGDTPALYGSAQLLADEQLRPLHRTSSWPRGPSFAGALTENIVTGCTAALNGAGVRLLQQGGVPAGVRFHDWWLYLVVSAFGSVVFDEEPTLLYRQHGANQIGHGAGWWGRQRQILRFLLRNDWVGILLAQVAALQRCYGEQLTPAARELVQRHFVCEGGRAAPRWRLVFSRRRWRHTVFGEAALRVLLAAHRLRVWPPPGRRLDLRIT